MRAGRRAASVVALALAISALGAQAAFATFHEIVIREVYTGTVAAPESEYVELQMYASGQEFVKGHKLSFYNAGGGQIGTAEFKDKVGSGANQATILVATTAAEAEFGVTADLTMAANLLGSAGGGVCWEAFDCVSWGAFGGSLAPSAGTPAAAAPDGQALRRTIAPGCASLLEESDDKNNSAAEFEAVFPAPRPNSVTPTEKACGGQGGGGGPGGGGGGGKNEDAPQTTLRGKPAKKTRDRTPTFRFGSSDGDASFQCKLDGKPFKACRSPFTTRKLGYGKHAFRVRAKGHDGTLDPSPALFAFTVLEPR